MRKFSLIFLLISFYGATGSKEIFNPDDYNEFYDVQAESEHDEEMLDPLTRPPKCFGLALADATDIGPYQAGALIGLLRDGQKY